MTSIHPIRTRRARYALAVLAVLAPVLAMFGFAPTAAAAQLPPPQTITVPISNFAFAPADLTVHAGDTVTWVNQDRAPHDVTSTGGPASFGSGTLMQGGSFSYTFTTPGTYSYQCTIHPNMVASVTAMEHEVAAPVAPIPPPVEAAPEAPEAPEAPADGAPAGDPAVPGAPADGAAAAAPGAPPAAAPVAPAPAPGAAVPGTQPAPATSPVAGAAQPVRQLNPLLIVAGFAVGLATLCLLMISTQATGAPVAAPGGAGGGAVVGAGMGAGSAAGPRDTATMARVGHRRERRSMALLLRVVAAVGLAIDAYVHFDLAADYDVVGTTITQGTLFRLQGVVAALAGLAILLISNPRVYQVVFLTAVSALFPVVLYTYVDVGPLGPLPNMYEPVWYADKTISAIGEAVAALAAAGLVLLTRRPRSSRAA